MSLRTVTITKTVAPAASTTAYVDGDQVGIANELTNVVRESGGTGNVVAIAAVDKEKKNIAVDLLFFDSDPSVVGADSAAADISDANMVAKFLGVAKIAASDWASLSNSSYASINKTIPIKAASGSTSIYMVVVARGSATFGSAGGYEFKVGILAD